MDFITRHSVGLVAIVIAIAGLYFPVSSVVSHYGGITNYDEVDATAIKVGGTNGSRLGPIITTTCNAQQKSTGSFAASSSAQFYCAVSGAASGDSVTAVLPVGAGANADGAGSLYGGFVAHTGNATSTGFVQFSIENWTGAATSTFTQATTSVTIYLQHPVTSVPGL